MYHNRSRMKRSYCGMCTHRGGRRYTYIKCL